MSLIISLLLIALILFFFEIWVPGGILAIMGVILMVAACVVALNEYGLMGGLFTFLISLFLSIIMLVLELKLLRHTRIGQRFFLKTVNKATSLRPQASDEVIGKEGEAFTRLNPTGIVRVDGHDYEAFSQKGMLEKGAPIKVVSQDTFRLIVDKVNPDIS